jgi:predicted nuclease of predicted toxin-antitoxin system
VRFLVDESLSPRVAELLRVADHDAVHVREIGLKSAPDPVVLEAAASEERVLITADTDFGGLLVQGRKRQPSVVLFRGEISRRPESQASVLLANLEQIQADLEEGAITVIGDRRMRVRRLRLLLGDEED